MWCKEHTCVHTGTANLKRREKVHQYLQIAPSLLRVDLHVMQTLTHCDALLREPSGSDVIIVLGRLVSDVAAA